MMTPSLPDVSAASAAHLTPVLAAVRAELREVRADLHGVTADLVRAHDERLKVDVRHVERLATRAAAADASHAALTVGMVALLNGHHERRHEWDGRLQGLWERIAAAGRALEALARRFGDDGPPPPAHDDGRAMTMLTDHEAEAGEQPLEERVAKRLRTAAAPRPTADQHPYPDLAATLRAAGRPTTDDAPPGLTAGQFRLWDTVLPQSALMPDVAALYDVYHPALALYDRARDAPFPDPDDLAAGAGVQLGLLASTILTPRGRGRFIFFDPALVPGVLPPRARLAALHVPPRAASHGL